MLGALARDEQLALERVPAQLRPVSLRDEDLVDVGLAFARKPADRVRIGRNPPPGEQPQAFGLEHVLDHLMRLPALGMIGRHKDHADAVLARIREGETA